MIATEFRQAVRGVSAGTWGILGLAAASAVALALVSASPYERFLRHDYEPSSRSGQVVALSLFLLGWTLMIAAMMLPTAVSLLAAVGRLVDDASVGRRLQARSAGGFLAVWVAVGYLFRAGDLLVHACVDSINWLGNRPELIGAAVVLAAGLFQFSSLKYRCLTACRMPTGFIYRNWHGHNPSREAIMIGASYGVSCVGCCWALMLVMFALGMSNLAWMLGFGILMAAEKNSRFGHRLSFPIGVALIAAATFLALH